MKNVSHIALPIVLAVGLASAGWFATERVARADVPPPNMTCGNKKPGDSCVDDEKKAGTCSAQKCSRMGMAPGPNGTMERKVVEYDCTLCVAGSAAPASSGSPSSPAEKKGCNTSGTTPGDAGLFVLGALGLLGLRRRR
jgi:MYXO-CTERM domain-containing protein